VSRISTVPPGDNFPASRAFTESRPSPVKPPLVIKRKLGVFERLPVWRRRFQIATARGGNLFRLIGALRAWPRSWPFFTVSPSSTKSVVTGRQRAAPTSARELKRSE